MTTHTQRGTKKSPPSLRPWPCVILAVDPGEAGGAALFDRGKIVDSGPVKRPHHRRYWVADALKHANADGLPLIVVAETWTHHGKLNFKAALGLGAQWGRWQEHIDSHSGQVLGQWHGPKVVRVDPGTWRRALFGSRWGNKGTGEWKELARVRAAAWQTHIQTDDEAEAICIGLWAMRAGEVGDVLPAKFRRAA